MSHDSSPIDAIPAAAGSVEQSWLAIEAISTSMHAEAANENWMQVVELAAARHRDLLRHFEDFPVGPDNAGFYQRRLAQMLEHERALQALALNARKQVMRESVVTNYNHRAVNAYLTR